MNVITDVPKHLLNLPDTYEPPAKVLNMVNNVPDIESLTPEQRVVFDYIIAYLEGKMPEIRMIVFKGYAGTGKTYVMSQVLKWYVLMMQNNIAMTAPTNKAVKVLKESANFVHSLIKFCTIHKLYGLKEKTDERTGKKTFEPEYGEENEIDETQALIIDETSMLPDQLFYLAEGSNRRVVKNIRDNKVSMIGDDLDGLLSKLSKDGPRTYDDNLKVVFLGDPIQIPPVGKTDCIPFNPGNSDEYDMKVLELTEIIRQKEGNPILDLATITRLNYKKSFLPYERITNVNEHGGIAFINAKDAAMIFKVCEVYFSNPRFQHDSDFMKVIAWTNKTVDFMNAKIRTFVHKERYDALLFEAGYLEADTDEERKTIKKTVKLPRILIGEKLIADKPITEDIGYKRITLFSTSDEFEVLEYSIKAVDVFSNYEVDVYRTKVLYVDNSTGKRETKVIDILHEDSAKTFDELTASLKQKALKAAPHERGQAWKVYYMISEKFAAVKYNYAITAHKSQGSTYENTMVIVADIDDNSKIEERNRIKYVAFTRPKKYLFIVE